MAKETYTSQEISTKYDNLSYKEKAEVLYGALDYMSQFNGRTKFLCIALAMGYDNIDEGLYIKRGTS